ncbi:MAG: hypothetical protein HY720_14790 [Planctomycetes bacterium]|nr:hypothetical protein [Planctomycetota bacterium]
MSDEPRGFDLALISKGLAHGVVGATVGAFFGLVEAGLVWLSRVSGVAAWAIHAANVLYLTLVLFLVLAAGWTAWRKRRGLRVLLHAVSFAVFAVLTAVAWASAGR